MANKNNYFYIKNYSSNGEMAISKHAFEEIVLLAIKRVKFLRTYEGNKQARNFNLYTPVHCEITKNNKVNIKVDVVIKKEGNVKEVCLKAQDEIKNAFLLSCESLPNNIVINVCNLE